MSTGATPGMQIASQINTGINNNQVFVPNPSGIGGYYMNVAGTGNNTTLASTKAPTPAATTANKSTTSMDTGNKKGTTNISQIVGIAAPIVTGIIGAAMANKQANEARDRATEQQNLLRALESSRQEIFNPYQNLSVATKAAEMQAEEADIALANTLDTIRATGASAGGATALAQAALKSKQGISANIEQQEVANEKLRAQGEQFVFQTQEQREMQKLDRTAGLLDRELAQEAQYRSDMMGAITGSLGSAAQLGLALGGSKSKTK